MIKSHRSVSVVVAGFLGLFLVLAVQDTSQAAALQRDNGGAEVLSVKLAFYDLVGLDPEVASGLQGVVASIFEEIDVAVEWIDTEALANGSGPSEGEYIKVLLWARPLAAWGVADGTMGHAPVSEFPRSSVFVFDSRVRGALQNGKRRSLALGPGTLGRALGRATAHEVVHALTPEQFHTSSGLMREAHDRQTLTCPEMPLDERSAAEARRGLMMMQALADH